MAYVKLSAKYGAKALILTYVKKKKKVPNFAPHWSFFIYLSIEMLNFGIGTPNGIIIGVALKIRSVSKLC